MFDFQMAWTCVFEMKQAKMLVDYMQNFSEKIFWKATFWKTEI